MSLLVGDHKDKEDSGTVAFGHVILEWEVQVFVGHSHRGVAREDRPDAQRGLGG